MSSSLLPANQLSHRSVSVSYTHLRVLCVSDASFAAIDAGRGLEHLILLLYGLEGSVTPERENLLREILLWLEECRMFLEKKKGEPPVLKRECFVAGSEDQTGEESVSYTHLDVYKRQSVS